MGGRLEIVARFPEGAVRINSETVIVNAERSDLTRDAQIRYYSADTWES